MKYKIKIVEIDECVEDVEFFVDFMFMDSHIKYRAALFDVRSKMLQSLLGQEINADLTLETPSCKHNKEKQTIWLKNKLAPDNVTDTWHNPADFLLTSHSSAVYLCAGKILGIVRDEFERNYYRLQSEHNIDVFTRIYCWESDDIKSENIQIGEYYSFRGILSIRSIDEIEEFYKNKL